MFNKKIDDTANQGRAEPPVREAPNVSKRKTSVIGPTLRFKGELSANEDLIIEGQIEGVIAHHDKNLTVGKEGRVKANIAARTVEIYGYVEGDVRGEETVKLAESSVVKGNIFCARIIMEKGAQFSGSVDTSQRSQSSGKAAAPGKATAPGAATAPPNAGAARQAKPASAPVSRDRPARQ